MLKCFSEHGGGTHIIVEEILQLMPVKGENVGLLCIQPLTGFECSNDAPMPLQKLVALSELVS